MSRQSGSGLASTSDPRRPALAVQVAPAAAATITPIASTWEKVSVSFKSTSPDIAPTAGSQLVKVLQIPTEAGRVFRFEVGHRSDMKPASIPK
jgi:hypothetical protein